MNVLSQNLHHLQERHPILGLRGVFIVFEECTHKFLKDPIAFNLTIGFHKLILGRTGLPTQFAVDVTATILDLGVKMAPELKKKENDPLFMTLVYLVHNLSSAIGRK